MKTYRKKPVEIQAFQLNDTTMWDVFKWINTNGGNTREWSWDDDDKYIKIETLEGVMKASEGDYIIKGISGEFYPCKPDIFEKTYEEVY